MQEVRRKYGCLRAIGIVILLLAWVILFLGLAGAVLSWLSTPRMFSGIQLAMLQVGTGISLVIALTLFFQWFVFGSVLTLMTDLEHNTRRNAEAVSRLVALAEAPERTMASLPSVAAAAPVAPVPPPPPLTPTLESKAATSRAVVAAGSAVAAAGAASLAEGPLPPPPPMAPSIVAEVEAAAAGTAAGVQDAATGAGDAFVVAGDAVDEAAGAVEFVDVAGAVDAVASQVEPIEPVG